MNPGIVGKRRFHTFLSHAHVDKDMANHVFNWLRDIAAVPVWYDAVNLPPGQTIVEGLSGAIESSRSMIVLLSKQSVSRGWVKQEYRAAINHQAKHPDFRIIPLRLDDVEPPDFMQNYSNITLAADGLDTAAAASILKGPLGRVL